MKKPRQSDDELVAQIGEMFREYGFEGTSLTRLSEKTGLKRSSLYHRFPGGKSDMVEAVFDQVDEYFETEILQPCFENGSPEERAEQAARRLREFYRDGDLGCLLEVMSLADAESWSRDRARESFNQWREAFTRLANEAGVEEPETRAEDAIARIQGALVVSRLDESTRAFERATRKVPDMLTSHDH